MRVSSTGLPFLLPPEAGLVSPSAGVSLWLLSLGAVDAQKGLPRWHSSSSSSSAAAVCSVQGSGARAIPPRDGLRALKLVFIPRPDRLSPNLFLFSFSSGATGFFFPPNQSDRERVARGERCPCLRKDWKGRKGCLLGSWPGQPAGWRWSSCILDASLFRLCAFHTHTHTQPFTAVLTHPSFMLPLVGPACQCPHPLRSLFLLLPCLALALTLGITHSLSVHNSSSELAHGHTHSYCSGTWFPCKLPAMHAQCPCHYTHAHLHTHTPRELFIPCLYPSS